MPEYHSGRLPRRRPSAGGKEGRQYQRRPYSTTNESYVPFYERIWKGVRRYVLRKKDPKPDPPEIQLLVEIQKRMPPDRKLMWQLAVDTAREYCGRDRRDAHTMVELVLRDSGVPSHILADVMTAYSGMHADEEPTRTSLRERTTPGAAAAKVVKAMRESGQDVVRSYYTGPEGLETGEIQRTYEVGRGDKPKGSNK